MATNNGWFKLTKSRLSKSKILFMPVGMYVLYVDTRYHQYTLIDIFIDPDDLSGSYADHPNAKVTSPLEDLVGFWLFKVPNKNHK